MNITTVPALDARRQLGELLERVYYQDQQFQIMRKDKPMAWLVSPAFVTQVGMVIDYLIEHEPAIADSLALSLDPELRAMIERGTQEKSDGKLLPLESILEDAD